MALELIGNAEEEAKKAQQQGASFMAPPFAAPPPSLGSGLSGATTPGVAQPGAQFMAGPVPGAMPTSAQGGFAQDGKSYNVADTSQPGALKITAPGTSPLYTNIKPEAAVAGLGNQTVGSDAEGLARMANANKIRGEMIANRDKDIPAGGYGPGILGDGGIEAANAEKTARWRQDDMIGLASRGNQGAIAAVLNANARTAEVADTNATHLQTAAMQSQAAKYGHDVTAARAAGHDQVIARGQDIGAQTEAAKLAGNPIDQQTKQLSLDAAKRVNDLHAAYQTEQDPTKRAALAEQIRVLGGKDRPASFSAIHAAGGTFVDPKNPLQVQKHPDSIIMYNTQTGEKTITTGGQAPEQPVPQGHKIVGTSGGKRVFEDAKGNRFIEGN